MNNKAPSLNNITILTALLLSQFLLIGCGPTSKKENTSPLKLVSEITVCSNDGCGIVGKEYSIDEVGEGLYSLYRENASSDFILCEADPKTKICTEKDINFYTMMPDQSDPILSLKSYKVGNIVVYDRSEHTVTLSKHDDLNLGGGALYSYPHAVTLKLESSSNISLIGQSAPIYQGFPHTLNMDISIDYIDVFKGEIAGYYHEEMQGWAYGAAKGYMLMRFSKTMPLTENWFEGNILKPRKKMAKTLSTSETPLFDNLEGDKKLKLETEKLRKQLMIAVEESDKKNEELRKKEIYQLYTKIRAQEEAKRESEIAKLRLKFAQEQKALIRKSTENLLKKIKMEESEKRRIQTLKEKEIQKNEAERLRIRALNAKENKKRQLANIKRQFGKYYALVIGNNNYANIQNLKTAVSDAKVISSLLKDDYGFEVKTLINATRSEVISALSKYRNKLRVNDNLLIYYAGHGILDEEADEGYWLPVDADKGDPVNWISNASITSATRAIKAKHVMIVADSCYSGKLTRGIDIVEKSKIDKFSKHLVKISQSKARVVITSGDLEPVADEGGKGNHSLFNTEVVKVLKNNDSMITGSEVFNTIRRPMMLNSDQKPRYSDIRKAGHDGGDFIFIRSSL